jgi:hypothetical protein
VPSSIRVFAVVRSVSKPFNGGRLVEVKLSTEDSAIVDGELYLRVSTERAKHYAVGEVFTLRMQKV